MVLYNEELGTTWPVFVISVTKIQNLYNICMLTVFMSKKYYTTLKNGQEVS